MGTVNMNRLAFSLGLALAAGAATSAWSAEDLKSVMERRGLSE
jgi:hypothetical protein